MISWAYSLATCTADSFLWLAVRLLYVFSAWSLEWHKTEASEALRASEALLWKKKTHSVRPQCSDLHSRKCLFHALLKKIHDSFSCICPIIDPEFWHNISSENSWKLVHFDNVMMKFIVNNRTDTKKLTSICFYINKLWNWPLLLVDASHQLYNLVSLSLLSMKSSQWVQNNFFTANLRGKRNSS